MKKIFMVIALMAMLMLPLTSFSMTAMEEGDLSSVTGQAGVSINLEARVDLKADTVAWGDMDGFEATNVTVTSGSDAAGWIGLSNLNIDNLRIQTDQTLLRANFYKYNDASGQALDAASIGLYQSVVAFATAYLTGVATSAFPPLAGLNPQDTASILGNAAALMAAPYSLVAEVGAVSGGYTAVQTAMPAVQADATGGDLGAQALLLLAAEKAAGTFTPFSPLTIDVATGTAAVPHYGEGITFVRIGLGSIWISMDSMTADVDLGPDTGYVGNGTGVANGVPDLKYQLGSLYLSDMFLRIGGGSYVDIFNDRGAGTQGVTIVTDVIIKNFTIGTLAWGDADGIDWNFTTDSEGVYGAHTTDGDLETPDTNGGDTILDAAGWVGLKGLEIDWINISGRIDIDVATDDALGTETGIADWTFVQIGLDALTVNMSGFEATAALGADATSVAGLDQELGELYISDLEVVVNGKLNIGARADGTQGVTLNLDALTIDITQGLTISWGDLDGVGGANGAGYVGLVGLNIADLTLQGTVTIDVATIRTGDTSAATSIEDMMYLGYRENNLSPTIVHIGLGTGNADDDTLDEVNSLFLGNALGISLSSLNGAIAFGTTNTLVGANTIGNFYVGGIMVGVNGWVDIGAH